jgi:putative ABC transport system substrate-binding protein
VKTGTRQQASGISEKHRIVRFALCAMLVALCSRADAQPVKIARIGYLSNRVATSPDVFEDSFRQGLRELSYVEGKNIVIDYRYAEGAEDRFPALVVELIQLKVNVFFSATIRGIRAAKQATNTLPIVMVTTADPVAAGLVDSLPETWPECYRSHAIHA